ncbi:hypothetical protein KVT40_003049 [Elsinoe batatas]|uniref:Caleosin-domain-containing protein n=1 Tax=Elsinoe batatas TaxID=2601811 RepID=A0A8K0L643_9PEZI|nr:hypothetical protein KVT40_003049 [Elsinoe batatas]
MGRECSARGIARTEQFARYVDDSAVRTWSTNQQHRQVVDLSKLTLTTSRACFITASPGGLQYPTCGRLTMPDITPHCSTLLLSRCDTNHDGSLNILVLMLTSLCKDMMSGMCPCRLIECSSHVDIKVLRRPPNSIPASFPLLPSPLHIAPTMATTTLKSTQCLNLDNIIATPHNKPYQVSLPSYPVTQDRPPWVPPPDSKLIDAGTARANYAPTNESPFGSEAWSRTHSHLTVVSQHAAYFDQDNDGVIWPLDTYRDCRNFGWSIPLSIFAMFIININLSYPTVPGWLPDPAFRIWLDRMHKDKHGSDSLSFDNEGRFRPQMLEDFFAKYDQGDKGGLDAGDLWKAHKGQRMVFDFWGWSASALEWLGMYLFIWPEDGIMRKEDVRGFFDRSAFQKKADQLAAKKKADAIMAERKKEAEERAKEREKKKSG